jgi:hypothetical protein
MRYKMDKELKAKFRKALQTKFEACDLNEEITIKNYMKELLIKLLIEQECFNGKRPFGESSWVHDIKVILIESGLMKGTVNPPGYGTTHAEADFREAIRNLVSVL